jgi:hypothetical protein
MIQLSRVATPTSNKLESSLPAQVVDLSARQIVSDVLGQNGNQAITSIDPGKVTSIITIPRKITVNLVAAADAPTDSESLIFNNADFAAANAKVAQTYSDGFGGKNISQLARIAANGAGILIYGFNIRGIDDAGNASDEVVNNSNPQVLNYNGLGKTIPMPIDLQGAERNTQFKNGLLTVKFQFMLSAVTQLSFLLNADEKLSLTFFTTPILD